MYNSYKTIKISPVIEVILQSVVIIGIILNVFIAFHVIDLFGLIGNVPIIILFVAELLQKHFSFVKENIDSEVRNDSALINWSWKVLKSKALIKFPLLIILCFPILIVISLLLLIFGQKPDSAIQAFTETYKHGFSQLDHLCENVECGGHFLCSVAAKGHKKVVSPTRIGVRGGRLIICNRQLLVANAFEDLIQEKSPRFHKFIRSRYNRVGDFVHKYYGIFNIKIISDVIYILMKPLEWVFLLVLYTVDVKPENRIAKQYVLKEDRIKIDRYLNTK